MGEHSERRRGSRSGGDRDRGSDFHRDRDDRYYRKKRDSLRRSDVSRPQSDEEDNHRASKLVRIRRNIVRPLELICGDDSFHYVFLMQAKRVEKHLKKHSKGSMHSSGYRDEENPFGDNKLSERFVWGKKIEKEIKKGASVKSLTASAQARRDRERMDEIEKVKMQREQREAERLAIAEELEMVQRERARAEAVELEKQEDKFHLEQAKVRAQQRLSAGRPKAIDIITNNLFMLDGFDKTAVDPNVFISELTVFQLDELDRDIEEYSQLDAMNSDHDAFWTALRKVTRHALLELRREEMVKNSQCKGQMDGEPIANDTESGWHPSLESDIQSMLDGKSSQELSTLELGIKQQLDSGDAADPDYWHSVLRRLDLFKAKSFLSEFHKSIVETELAKIKQGLHVPQAVVLSAERTEQAKQEAERAALEVEKAPSTRDGDKNGSDTMYASKNKQSNPEEIALSDDEHVDQEEIAPGETVHGPEPATQVAGPTFADQLYQKVSSSKDFDDTVIGNSNAALRSFMQANAVADSEQDKAMKAIASQAMNSAGDWNQMEESNFGGEVDVETKSKSWSSMYEPRKPKYFNRVHAGFDWTKYNKAHYDKDNPPPKVIQGYKFNIFYPDLINPSKTPSYSIEKDTESPDGGTCILRFSAGAPYEDVAFRIVNKRWDTDSKRSGFRCVFDRGILQLYFRFQKDFYKR